MIYAFSARTRVRARLAVAVSAVAVLAAATAASAAVPNIELHRSTSANTSATKSTSVACPPGRTLTGVGGDLTGAGGAVLIDDLITNSARTLSTTTGDEIQAYASNWYAHAYAICASPLAGATVVSASTASNGTDGKAVTATCPAGTQLTGAGGQITGALGNVVMDDLSVGGNPPVSVTVTGYEVNPEASWSATAHAICANPLPGLERVTVSSASNSSNKSATAACPAGKKVTGLGGAISGATGEVVIDDYTPSELLDRVTVTGSEAIDADGAFAGNWTVTAYAICATA